MANKKKTEPVQAARPVAQTVVVEAPPQPAPGKKYSIYDFKTQAIIVSVLAFLFYFNSFFNEFAHDDGIVIVKNEYVLEGFAGIPGILTKDAYDSYYRQLNTTNQLSGGRYRPLSIVTFAIEQQFMGPTPADRVDSILKESISYGIHGPQEQKVVHDMHFRHIFNVAWYILSLIALLYFLRYIVFKHEPLMALIATVIFTIHPLHTEVVANVKSRDEIMSLLFMCTTFIYTFKYYEQKKISHLAIALVSYFLAFLSKEYAITMIVLLPLSLYAFNNFSFGKSILAFIPFALVIAAYLALRFSIVAPMGENSDNEVLNNPYLYASNSEKLATEISTSLNYLKLLLFPHPLSADYSYNTIPYKDFSHPLVWLSIAVHVSLFVIMILSFFKIGDKKASPSARTTAGIFCFATAFYLLHLLMVCNIVFDIGATMGERLIYHSSVGFAIAVAWFLVKGFDKIQPAATGQRALAGVMGVIIILCGYKTIARNAEWKNDTTLFNADIKTVPNSVLVTGNVAASDITLADFQTDEKSRQEYLYRAINILNHTLTIHHSFVAGYLNRGIAWYKLGEIDKAKPNFDTVRTLYPNYPTLPGLYKLLGDYYMKKGWNDYGKVGKYPEAINELKKGIAVDSSNAEIWYNLGGAYFSNKQYAEAASSWQMALKINPNYIQAQQALQAAMGAIQSGGQPPTKK